MSPTVSVPLLDTLGRALRILDELAVPYALMGGIAMAAWGRLRATQDTDLLLGLSQVDSDRLLSALRQAGFKFQRDPPLTEIGGARLLQAAYAHPDHFLDVRTDLLLADHEFHKLAVRRAIPLQFDGLTIPVVTLEDLIVLKLAAGRVLDRVDAAEIYRARKSQLELDYLRRAAASLGCEPILDDLLAGRLGP